MTVSLLLVTKSSNIYFKRELSKIKQHYIIGSESEKESEMKLKFVFIMRKEKQVQNSDIMVV
jgi:hypothetical protein